MSANEAGWSERAAYLDGDEVFAVGVLRRSPAV